MSSYLGFFLGQHDSNVAIVKDGLIHYRKSERTTGQKHHRADISFVHQMLAEFDIENPTAVAYTDGNRNGLGSCPENLLFTETEPLFNCPTFNLDHHYAHTLSVFPIQNLQQVKWGISIDGRGDHERRISVIKNPAKAPELVHYSFDKGICYLLNTIGKKMGLTGRSIDFPGKIMGLQAYGIPNQEYVSKCKEIFHQDPLLIPFLVPWHKQIEFDANDQDFKDWIASVHLVLEEYVLELFRKFCHPDDVIAYTGGAAQNTVINMRLKREFPNLVIPPHCYDGGLSLGCIEFLRIRYNEQFQNHKPFPYWQDDEIVKDPRDEVIEEIADHLAAGRLVGWYQGNGEIGPRALGNRSLLFDPRHENGHEIVNRVKQREPWRPFAGSVLKESASTFFELDDSPYMLYACGMKMPDIMPAIAHVDNTCRIQTVEYRPTCGYTKLLKAFERRTGIPILLNTSLNMGGKPIVSTTQDAIEMFQQTEMDVLCLGNRVMKKPHC